MKRVLVGALIAGGLLALTPQFASAQVVTSDPIQTVPGYPGCGGNQTQQDVTSTIVCANQRTFHFGNQARTVVAVSTMNPDGSASTTFTITGGTAPADVPLTVRAWSGVSAGGTLFSSVTGVIPKGTAGPVTLSYQFDCGQVDVKAVFTSTSNGNGRISGGFFCKEMTVATTAPTTAPGSTVAPTTSPPSPSTPSTQANSTSSGPGASASAEVVGTIPATGSESSGFVFFGVLALISGSALFIIGRIRRRARS